MRYWRPITNQDVTIALLLGLGWVLLILLWVFADYSTAEYKIVPCKDDICNVWSSNINSICFAQFTTLPITGLCGVECPEAYSGGLAESTNTTLPCNFNKETNCPILVCKKYTDIGLFFSLIGVSIIIVGATMGMVLIELLGYHTRPKEDAELIE